jgi:hypothetical protein
MAGVLVTLVVDVAPNDDTRLTDRTPGGRTLDPKAHSLGQWAFRMVPRFQVAATLAAFAISIAFSQSTPEEQRSRIRSALVVPNLLPRLDVQTYGERTNRVADMFRLTAPRRTCTEWYPTRMKWPHRCG